MEYGDVDYSRWIDVIEGIDDDLDSLKRTLQNGYRDVSMKSEILIEQNKCKV